ncbi:MAG: hypothetical protein C0621_06645 [Desulfuromonas sp.]|nr:MAG: hypothetical protein C0621_06645 [Desulfuromonas sp.]
MPIPELVKRQAEKLLTTYCQQRVPDCMRNQLRIDFRIRDNMATLYEERVLPSSPDQWLTTLIAQLRFHPELDQWTLHYADRSGKWHPYLNVPPTLNFSKLLEALDSDPLGFFWG